jgi:HEPN domain-containing protein
MAARIFSVAKEGLVPSDFLQSGLDHMTAAKLLFESSPYHFDSGGYLAHIAVELLIKAWLLETAGEFEGVHNLQALYSRLVEKYSVPALNEERQATLVMLDQFEQLRYPNRKEPVEIGEADFPGILALVGHLCDSIPQAIPNALEQEQRECLRKGGRVLMKKRIS